ncbi:agmatinase [Methanomassiliicoccus luminyensis]|jgi:agmatinase|uniref:agmatinase n=1 Tax=Methanomassiliicoccus luminyensis TaxID=1080712 RepID=UPI000370DA32|nr:agmatinase [Methanomassiliicoccus luminyensis]
MSLPGITFLGADSSYEDAKYIIVGVPFDRTTTYRPGTRSAPNAIREASYNFEKFLFEHNIDLNDVKTHDMGDLGDYESPQEMVEAAGEVAKRIVRDGKFPIFLGGEHSVSIPAITAFKDVGVISIDAHLDYRDSYMGQRYSHACVSRRTAEHVGRDNLLVFGIRSMSKEEAALDDKPEYIDAYTIAEEGVEKAFKRALNIIKKDKIYLSLDIDGIDPAFAPGTGVPEPFGLTSLDVKKCISMLGPRMVGFDVVEISPPFDKGNTSALGARMVQEAIAVSWKYRSKGDKEHVNGISSLFRR